MALMTACKPDDPITQPPAGEPTKEPVNETAALLIGCWNMTEMNGQTLSGGLYSIDEYRDDGMYVSKAGNTFYGTQIIDSTRYTVVGDSIIYEDEYWDAEKILYLDSLNLSKMCDVAPYGTIYSDFERM